MLRWPALAVFVMVGCSNGTDPGTDAGEGGLPDMAVAPPDATDANVDAGQPVDVVDVPAVDAPVSDEGADTSNDAARDVPAVDVPHDDGNPCPSGETECMRGATAVCLDTQTSPYACGSCDVNCSDGTCAGGVCACRAGWILCPGPTPTSQTACTNPFADALNCGGCGMHCPVNHYCTNNGFGMASCGLCPPGGCH